MNLAIPREIVQRILGHAQRSLPNECVGILSEHAGRIDGWHPLTNVATDPRRFLADPGQQIALMRRLREEGREMAAIYHSHPQGPPALSATDLDEAWHPACLHLVVALGTQGRLELAAFRVRDGKSEAVEVEVL